jgi:hypothetical protein
LCSQLTYDPSENLLQEIDKTWAVGDYNSPVVKSMKITDKLGQTTTTLYTYVRDLVGGDEPPTNQLNDIAQLDYGGKTTPCTDPHTRGCLLRDTSFTYETDHHYFDRHIFNLPASATISDQDGQVVSKAGYVYDDQPLVNTPGVVGYADPGTSYRGNLTQVKRYKGTAENSPSITEFRRYDMTGNLVEDWGPWCVDTTFTYTPATQFAYPEQITRGDAVSTAPVRQSFAYDPSTGLLLSTRDANGLISRMSYDKASLRLYTKSLPASATTSLLSSGYVQYAYDDSAMSVTQSSYIPR